MDSSRRPLAAVTAGISLLLAACASAPPPYSYAPPQLGSTWRMAAQNTGSFGKDAEYDVKLRSGTWKGQPVLVYENTGGGASLADPKNGGFHAVLAPSGQPVATYDPPIAMPYPLQLGRSLTVHETVTIAGRVTGHQFDWSCKVAAYEKVVVRAGTFDAYRVECAYGDSTETRWVSPQLGIVLKNASVRGPGNPSGPGTQQTELVSQDIRK